MLSQSKGIIFAVICVFLYALFSIFFKIVSILNLHSMLFITVSMVFASVVLLLKGGYNKLIFEAIKSLSTWVYSISFVLIFIFSIELLKYISATEMILVSRLNILISLVFSFFVLKRNTLGQGIWGVPLIVCGLIIVFAQVEHSILYVLFLGLCSAIAKSSYYFAIELNKTGYKSKNYIEDFGILGFILAISSIISIVFMLTGSITTSYLNIETRIFPSFADYTNPVLFGLAALYGVIGFTLLRYLEFKSVQSIKSEIFLCLITLVPIIAMSLESFMGFFNLFNYSYSINPLLLLSNILIITGGLLVVILRITNEELTDELDKKYLVDTVRKAIVFADDNVDTAAELLAIEPSKIKEIVESKNFKVTKKQYKSIIHNFNNKIAMSDSLTGLCNKLEFKTKLAHLDKTTTANLFYIDLNKFKPVNDTYGHDAGDFILKGISRRLENLYKDCLLTRLGGDEFALLVSNSKKADAEQMIMQILSQIENDFLYKGEKLNVSAAIGAANFPEDTDDFNKLISLADKQMYKNKK